MSHAADPPGRRCAHELAMISFLQLFFVSTALSIAFKDIRQLVPGATLRGTTRDAERPIQLESVYRAGQVIFNITSPVSQMTTPEQANQIVQVTTCSEFTQFDTILFAYTYNMMRAGEKGSVSDKPLDANDNDCEEESTLELAISPGQSLFILLTGYGSAEGQYEIRTGFLSLPYPIPLPWGLDRIDQRTLPLNNKYSVLKAGQGVFAYVLDSGVRISHSEFQNEDGSRRAIFGTDVVDRHQYSVDSTGHGTHVAAIIGGRNVGVARRVVIVSVRVLDRNGIGYTARLTEGLDWALADIRRNKRSPAVIAMSLSTPRSEALNAAVARIIEAGIPVVTAAGNSMIDSCSFSPASERSAITVASTNREDSHSDFSNFGGCIDIYAPGEQIYSAWHTGDHAMKNLSGTSAACPHVVGTVAALLADNPSLLPDEISSVINTTATKAVVDDLVLPGNSSNIHASENSTNEINKLVYIRPLPTLLQNPRPEIRVMFIYSVFSLSSAKYDASHCLLTSDVNMKTVELIESTLSIPDFIPSATIALCCSDLDLAGCDINAPSDTSRIVLQIATRDHHASSIFKLLETMIHNNAILAELGSILDAKVNVLYDPWVVDSRGYKYWTAPSLEDIERGKLSTAQLALVGVAACIFAVFLAAIIFCILHRRKERRLRTEKEEFERNAADFEKSNEKVSNLTIIENDPTVGYRKQGIKRENTDLFGDVLRNISASTGLITPRFFGGLMTPRRGGKPEDRLSPNGRRNGHQHDINSFKERELSNMHMHAKGAGSSTPQSSSIRPSEAFTPQSAAFKQRGFGPFSSFYTRTMGTPRERDRGRPPAANRPSSTIHPPSTPNRRGPWETGRIMSFGPGQSAIIKSSAAASASPSQLGENKDATESAE